MGIIMLVMLYTSRIVLAQLGIDDYGVYIVVGGVVTMFSFINSSMTTSTQRYLNFELGKSGDYTDNLKKVFSNSLSIHCLIAIIVAVAAETVGLWFVNNKLVIPESSMKAANIVYQTSILSFCISILKVPYNAAIIAHEHMHIYAVVSIVEAALKLAIAYVLMLAPSNRLALYGILLLLVHLIIASIYILICLHRYRECSLKPTFDSGIFKEMFGFAGWNMFGSIAWLVRGQGMGIVLNLFFGPALNAAKGVSDQVSTAVNTLSSNFQIALNPQITKNFASNHIHEMELLTYRGIKFSSFLLWMTALPIMLSTPTILDIWLENVPPYSSLFVVLILFDCISGNLFGTPLMTSLSATGNIKTYQITVSCVLLLILPFAYFALKLGYPPETIFYLNIIFNILSGLTRFAFCKKQLGYSFKFFLGYAIGPVLALIIISGIISYSIDRLFIFFNVNRYVLLTCITLISVSIVITLSWFVGLNNAERGYLKTLIMTKIHHGKNM